MAEKRKIRVLAIEDDPFCVAIYRHYGEKMKAVSLEIQRSVALEESFDFLDKNREIDIIFLDYLLHTTFAGLEILQHIRAKGVTGPVLGVEMLSHEEAVGIMAQEKDKFDPRIWEVFLSH